MAINNPNDQQNQVPSNRQGTGFTNLQQLMAANQGNKLGQAVGAGIQQAGQQVKSGIQTGQQQFQTEAQKNQLGTQSQRENVQNVLKDPSQVSDADIANFARYRSGQYTGPQDLANINTLQGQAQQAQQQGKAIGSESGRQSLLQRYAAGPGQYGAGSQRLDTLLLGTTGAKPLQEARRSVSGLVNQVGGAEQAAQQQAQQYAQQAKGFGQQVTSQVKGAQGNIYNPAQAQAAQANVEEQQRLAASQAAIQAAQEKNQLSQEALQALGLQSGQRTYGANLAQYLGYNPQNEQATALNVMSQPQFQQYTGLQKLMGQTPSAAPQTAYQAGKMTYDTSAASNALKQAQEAYQTEFNPISQAANNLKTPEEIQHQIDWLRGAYGKTWNGAWGEVANQIEANRLTPLKSQLQDIENRYGGTIQGNQS